MNGQSVHAQVDPRVQPSLRRRCWRFGLGPSASPDAAASAILRNGRLCRCALWCSLSTRVAAVTRTRTRALARRSRSRRWPLGSRPRKRGAELPSRPRHPPSRPPPAVAASRPPAGALGPVKTRAAPRYCPRLPPPGAKNATRLSKVPATTRGLQRHEIAHSRQRRGACSATRLPTASATKRCRENSTRLPTVSGNVKLSACVAPPSGITACPPCQDAARLRVRPSTRGTA